MARIGEAVAARADTANNTIRSVVTSTRLFLRWCHEHGYGPPVNERAFTRLLRSYPATYGKQQAPKPARWLTRDEAFGKLIAACQDDTDRGLRDELVIRLGLLGLRNSEIRSLMVTHFSALPSVTWLAKGRKIRTVKVGPAFLALFDRYLARYTEALGRELLPDDPIICPSAKRTPGRIVWGTAYNDRAQNIGRIVSERAALAGLGHVAPHDLRRTMAGLLHGKVDPSNGAHHYDLRDIQKALGHARPETTARYLELLETNVLDRAARDLD